MPEIVGDFREASHPKSLPKGETLLGLTMYSEQKAAATGLQAGCR